MSDSTDKSDVKAPIKKGFRAYWGRTIKRSFMDTTSFLGAKPVKAGIGLGVVVITALMLSLIFGHDAWDKVAWSVLTLVVTAGIFLACWFIFVLRTPWKFEDEIAIEREKESKRLFSRIDELERLLQTNQRPRSIADAEQDVKRREIRRWIASAEELQADIDTEIAVATGPFLSNELVGKIVLWTSAIDSYVKTNFPDFLELFHSDAGMPPMQPVIHWDIHRKEVYRRTERLKDLRSRFEPDARQPYDADEHSASQKRKLRERIGRLLANGNELMVAINRSHDHLPVKEAQDWMNDAAAQIGKLLDSSYVARFHNPAGTGSPDLESNPKNRLLSVIRFRLMRLNEFVTELSPTNT